jgi:adenosylcobinamide kinase / adenosylcobinamide-phosphate guanylyltransferase
MALAADQKSVPVTFIVTAEALDGEMDDRIARHQAERPSHWNVIEAPRDMLAAVQAAPHDHLVVIDCLSFWVANLVMDGTADAEAIAVQVAGAIAARSTDTIIVTNEAGLGLVPEYELGRRFRDVLGRVNATIAAVADDAYFVVAGRTLRLER